MRRSFQALVVILMSLVMIGGTVTPALASTNRASGSLRWVFMSGSATGGKLMSVRVTLWDVAPAGGAMVLLSSSNPAVKVPGMVTVPAGESEVIVKVKTLAVTENTPVIITAKRGDRVRRARTVVLRPYLSSTTVQTRIKSGSLGKIIVRLSGIAPEGGVTVGLNSNRPSVLPVPETIYFAPGKASVSINVPATKVKKDVDVNVSAMYRGIKITKPTIVRKFKPTTAGDPTATATSEVTETATSEATETGGDEPTATFTATPESTETGDGDLTATAISDDQTATAEADETATKIADDATATQTSIDQTATAVSEEQTATAAADQTATQESIDQTATQVATDETATQQAIDATETASADATATSMSDDATATQIASDETATQTSIDATATQVSVDATATQIAIDESSGDHLICHSTGVGVYNPLSLNVAGIVNGHYASTGGDHDGVAGDIIPPFEFNGQWYEQNWDAAGQAIYNNGCQAPVEQSASEGDQSGNEDILTEETDESITETFDFAPQSLSIWVDAQNVPTGSTVSYTVCLTQPTTSDVTISWYPGQAQFDDPVNSGSVTIPAGASGGGLCFQVSFSGLNRGQGAPTGVGNLYFALSDGQVFSGPEVTFKGKG